MTLRAKGLPRVITSLRKATDYEKEIARLSRVEASQNRLLLLIAIAVVILAVQTFAR
jgi:hypothetical protein